jgi:hypothetical protein
MGNTQNHMHFVAVTPLSGVKRLDLTAHIQVCRLQEFLEHYIQFPVCFNGAPLKIKLAVSHGISVSLAIYPYCNILWFSLRHTDGRKYSAGTSNWLRQPVSKFLPIHISCSSVQTIRFYTNCLIRETHKKGYKTDCSNYRGKPLSTSYIILSNIILSMLSTYIYIYIYIYMKLLGIISVGFDITEQLLIIFLISLENEKKNGRQYISYSWNSRKPIILLGGKYCTMF